MVVCNTLRYKGQSELQNFPFVLTIIRIFPLNGSQVHNSLSADCQTAARRVWRVQQVDGLLQVGYTSDGVPRTCKSCQTHGTQNRFSCFTDANSFIYRCHGPTKKLCSSRVVRLATLSSNATMAFITLWNMVLLRVIPTHLSSSSYAPSCLR